jgi:hypothetical protein
LESTVPGEIAVIRPPLLARGIKSFWILGFSAVSKTQKLKNLSIVFEKVFD